MKKILLVIFFLFLIYFPRIYSQTGKEAQVYLLTCGPGTETYSIYGHSALRIINAGEKSDFVYNWGVFDFETPNFAWKFAKGRLDYMLGVESMQGFLQSYFFEKRFVHSQKLNLSSDETAKLIELINENLKPENIKYRYDFFYDDCSTRIRDLIEKAVGKKLLYPPDEKGKSPTFREMVGKYQDPFPWLEFGIDLLMGSSADKSATYRDRMFLPLDLQNVLSESVINRDGRMNPLLQNPDVILDFDPAEIRQRFLLMPASVFTVLFIIIVILSAVRKSSKFMYWLDFAVYSGFSILAVLMIFFNFFTDHLQMRWNLNIIWLNPCILICLFSVILKRNGTVWFRLLFFISVAFLLFHLLLPQSFNIAFLPLVLILLIRSSVRSGFEWNPLSVR